VAISKGIWTQNKDCSMVLMCDEELDREGMYYNSNVQRGRDCAT